MKKLLQLCSILALIRAHRGAVTAPNLIVGVREKSVSMSVESVIENKFRVGKITNGKIELCGGNEEPFGALRDTASATEIADADYKIAVYPFSLQKQTHLCQVAGSAVTAYDKISTAIGGTAKPATGTGTHWVFGTALNDAAVGELVEYVPCQPYQLTIA